MAHIHEKIDFTVGVFIVYKNKVLLRMHDKYHIWLAVGGHVELNEDPNEAALREVKEEVGLDIKLWDGNKKFTPLTDDKYSYRELIPPVGFNRHNVSPEHEHVDFVYFASTQSDQVTPENPTDEWRWVTKDELDSLELFPDIKFYASLALDYLV